MTINTFRQDMRYNYNFNPRPRQTDSAAKSSTGLKNNPAECKTCAERKYQDKSDDPGVSFKMAGHIGGSNSVSAVSGHEREHETRESQKADQNGEYVVYSRIRIKMDQCPECKKIYSSGGETEVVTAKANQLWSAQIDLFNESIKFIDGGDSTGLLFKLSV